MESDVYELHLEVGKMSGESQTCGTKVQHNGIYQAEKAAAAHNQWDKRKHDVQAYPCFFCDHWHVGGIMTIEELKAVIATG